MSWGAALRNLFKKFIKNRRGAVIILIALNFLTMAGLTGAAIDTARAYYLKSELMSALDAAALAGGATVNSPNFNANVNKYFSVNFPSGHLGSNLGELQIAVDDEKEHVTLSTTANLDGTLMKVVGYGDSLAAAESEVTIERKGVEIALVMDNTGSMGTTNMEAMKSAATDLVNILYGSKETVDNLYVSLVPYTSIVNIGSSRTGWLSGYSAANYSPTTWKGCVFARGNETDDDTYITAGGWEPFLWTSSTDNPWKCASANSPFTYCANEMNLSRHKSTCGSSSGKWSTTGSVNINENQCAGNNGTGPNLGCGPAITPLTQSKTTITNAIGQMYAWSRGGTNSLVGLSWGWRVLSPKWQGLWGGSTPANLPLAYDEPLMEKAVVILTDGNNLWFDYDTSNSHNYNSSMTNYNGDMTAYKRPQDNLLGTTNPNTATNIINANFAALCESMKAEGIIIYTITFNLSNTTVQDLWRTCASKPSYYFNSPNAADLAGAFKTIGDSLSNLRISK